METTVSTRDGQHPPMSWGNQPSLVAFMPMLYVAWADGDLTDEEVRDLRSMIEASPSLTDAQREGLATWLDPSNPPSSAQLHDLLEEIQTAAAQLPDFKRRSLVGLGLEIARLNRTPESDGWPSPSDLEALEGLESALGICGPNGLSSILPTWTARNTPVQGVVEQAPDFDVEKMTAWFNRTYPAVRQDVRETLETPFFRHVHEYDKAAYRDQVLRWCRELSRRGIGALAFPKVTTDVEDLGGFIAAFETLGFFDLSLVVKFGVQYGLFGGSVYFLGTEEHHKLLPDIASLELPGCFAMTERGHGSNVRDLETVAVYHPETDTFEVNSPTPSSGKEWIGNAACHGRMATVFAQLEVDGERHGVHALLVPIRDENDRACARVRIEDCGHKMGLNGVDNGRLWFDRVHVPRANLLNRFGHVDEKGTYSSPIASPSRRFFTMLGTLVAGRISVASAALSAAKSGLTIAVRYSARRRQFGPEGAEESIILDYKTHQRRLMPLVARTYVLDAALKEMVQRFLHRSEEDEREVEAMAAALKAYSTWNTTHTLQTCREACGGQGYLSANMISDLKNDTDVFTTFEGDNTVLLQLVAKSLLTAWRRQFMDNAVFGVLRHLSRQISTAIADRNPYTSRRVDAEHLRSAEFMEKALRYRQESLTYSAAMRLKKRIDKGMDPFEAFNDVQIHLTDLARAYTDWLLFTLFDASITKLGDEDPTQANALRLLRNLFGLHTIESDMGWFLENDFFEASKATAIRKEVGALCAEVRTQAIPFVEAYGIPEPCINAPIARLVKTA